MTGRAMQPLPALLDRIADAAGEDAALLMAREYGGRPFYVPLPAELEKGHRLVELLGLSRARAVCAALGAGEIILPRGPFSSIGERKRLVAVLLAEGRSHPSIALVTNLHIRTIEKIAARLRDHETGRSQGRLF